MTSITYYKSISHIIYKNINTYLQYMLYEYIGNILNILVMFGKYYLKKIIGFFTRVKIEALKTVI